MLQNYVPTALDVWICDLYAEHGFNLNFHLIAAVWGIQVVYNPVSAFSFWAVGFRVISLDNRVSPEQQRADFFHELGHIALHDGRQRGLHTLMVQYQEWQARRFQIVAAMPYVLLPPPTKTWADYALLLAEKFAVPADVAARRVEMIRARRPY